MSWVLFSAGLSCHNRPGCQKMRKRAFLTVFCLVLVHAFPLMSCAADTDDFAYFRERMVERQIAARGIEDSRVLKAMRKVPRHLFVPERYRDSSYSDHPLPIGESQTISQPYIVAFMTEALKLKPTDRVLEIGTGSGYQAAVLAELVKEVYSIEIIEKLGKRAGRLLDRLGYKNVRIKIGDGYKGWPEKAPFDAVIVTCAPERIPAPLIEQLKDGGRMIVPVGRQGTVQKLIKAVKKKGRLVKKVEMPVLFVPMVKGREE